MEEALGVIGSLTPIVEKAVNKMASTDWKCCFCDNCEQTIQDDHLEIQKEIGKLVDAHTFSDCSSEVASDSLSNE